ncbi:hypothetical protein SAMN04488042_1011232 [Shimia aestuarii]|uniref:Phosphoadenosine phosphosulfate reductase n=2 Tax=Shimia aestuarii TaxID=254406 RepID=A0A1I4JY10_9RHOB|nr:hypothetical protein SAMN04488042_1011232 [Shimia aestuarii]
MKDRPEQTQTEWQTNLQSIGAREGFYEALGPEHTALFVERGKTLIVTFENLDHVYGNADDRMPWGYDFVTSRGWSMLGLMAHDWTWYRDCDVHDFFDRLREEGFFKRFDKVIFYGASMGAYAAAVFSSAAPGATVICISPQATLDRGVASWETRYRKAWKRNYTDRYGYAPDMVSDAEAVHLFYDPRAALDAMHAALFRGAHVHKYRCRFMGHRIASLWLQMGVLKPVIEGCVAGTMTDAEFYTLLRRRRETPRFQKEMLHTLEGMNRPKLLARYCRAVLARRRGPHFRKALRAAEQRIAKYEKKR